MRKRTEIILRQFEELKKNVNKMRLAAEGWDEKWKTLISILMSARTRDETTIIVAEKLFDRYETIYDLSKADLDEIKSIIKPVNFYRNKSIQILNCAKMLIDKYNGEVPEDFNKLVELSGVGRKTANVFLAELGFDEIGVDTHVAYISRFLGWTNHDDPDKIEMDLRELFPKRYWKDVNRTLVIFGKTYTSRNEKNKILNEIKEAIK